MSDKKPQGQSDDPIASQLPADTEEGGGKSDAAHAANEQRRMEKEAERAQKQAEKEQKQAEKNPPTPTQLPS
jgi:hypothetical protein